MPTPDNIHRLLPGDSIEISDATQLAVFEDILAEAIDPNMTERMRHAWRGRVALKDQIRPQKFNGTLSDIKLVVMADPYERLFDARTRGWRFGSAGAPRNRSETEENASKDTFRGFTFLALAQSSGKGVIGQIGAELWYGMVPTHLRGRGDNSYRAKNTSAYGGASIRRFMTLPRIEGAFAELHQTSRRIAFEEFRKNVRHPMSQPMRD